MFNNSITFYWFHTSISKPTGRSGGPFLKCITQASILHYDPVLCLKWNLSVWRITLLSSTVSSSWCTYLNLKWHMIKKCCWLYLRNHIRTMFSCFHFDGLNCYFVFLIRIVMLLSKPVKLYACPNSYSFVPYFH